MANAMTGGQAAVALLEQYGIDTVFGIPGVHTIEFYRGLADRGIHHVTPRHEQGAGFMADGYARVSGRPAACLLITGPGLTNAATPIAQAYSDSQPMVVLASTNLRNEIGKGWGPYHEVRNQRLIANQFTCFAGTALSPEDVPQLMAQGWSIMQSGRPRPYYVEIPRDVLGLDVTDAWQSVAESPRPRPAANAVEAAAKALSAATRPVMLVGAGAADASDGLTKLANRLNAPVISSFAGKGIVADSNPLSLGATLSMPPVREFITAADVVLAVGTELSTTDSSNQRLDIHGQMVRVDIDPRKINYYYPAAIGIVADSALFTEDVNACLDDIGHVEKPLHAERRRKIDDIRTFASTYGSLATPQHRRILGSLRKVLPDDGIVVTDMTQLAYSGNYCFPCEHPRTWIHPVSYATLGFALPAAIGAKLAKPEQPVVSISGDCGFLFTCQEMATAAERGIPIVQIVWNNTALAEIRDGMVSLGVEPVEVLPRNPDYVAMARSFHWDAETAKSLDHFETLLAEGIERQTPTLIEVREGDGDWAG